jgi:GWxTD domain-containing protein
VAEDVAYIISEPERAAFLRLTTDQEREHFIEQFWLRRDPTPGTAQNEAKEEHYRRIGYANQRFGTSQLPGWKTPRGRIYIIYGPPDQIESHYAQNNERWRYLSGPLADVILEFRLP